MPRVTSPCRSRITRKSITYNGGGKYTLNLNVVGKDTRESHEVTEKIEVLGGKVALAMKKLED